MSSVSLLTLISDSLHVHTRLYGVIKAARTTATGRALHYNATVATLSLAASFLLNFVTISISARYTARVLQVLWNSYFSFIAVVRAAEMPGTHNIWDSKCAPAHDRMMGMGLGGSCNFPHGGLAYQPSGNVLILQRS